MATYDLLFQDDAANPLPGIGVSLFGCDVNIESGAPFTQGTTNSGGVLAGVELPTAFMLYQFTTTDDDLSTGFFYAGSSPRVLVNSTTAAQPDFPPGYSGGVK